MLTGSKSQAQREPLVSSSAYCVPNPTVCQTLQQEWRVAVTPGVASRQSVKVLERQDNSGSQWLQAYFRGGVRTQSTGNSCIPITVPSRIDLGLPQRVSLCLLRSRWGDGVRSPRGVLGITKHPRKLRGRKQGWTRTALHCDVDLTTS